MPELSARKPVCHLLGEAFVHRAAYCERLGIPFAYDPAPAYCPWSNRRPAAYHRARAAVRFDEISQTLVHGLKYGDRLDLAPTMGNWMQMQVARFWPSQRLIPVRSTARQWMRRFNQSPSWRRSSQNRARPVVHGRCAASRQRRNKSAHAVRAPTTCKVPSGAADGKSRGRGDGSSWSTRMTTGQL